MVSGRFPRPDHPDAGGLASALVAEDARRLGVGLVSGNVTMGAALRAGPRALAPDPRALLVPVVMAVGLEADGDRGA